MTGAARVADARKQTFSIVMSAEVRRLARQGGLRMGLGTGALAGVLCGMGSSLLVRFFAEGGEGDEAHSMLVTLPVEVTAVITGIWFALAVVLHGGRDATSGLLTTAIVMVPRRRRLLAARALAAALVAGAVAIPTLLFTAAVAVVLSAPVDGGIAAGLLTVGTGAIGIVLLVTIAVVVAVLLRSAVAGALVFVALIVVLPLVVGVGQALLPHPAGAWLAWVSDVLPGALFVQAVSASTIPALGPGPLLMASVGLLTWAVAGVAGAIAMLERRDQ